MGLGAYPFDGGVDFPPNIMFFNGHLKLVMVTIGCYHLQKSGMVIKRLHLQES